MSKFIAPTGSVELENNLDQRTTRSRESVNPKEDLAFYFQTYLIPKYGLDNINVNNCASFMKELEMNWSKLTPELKDQVLDIMVDGIFTNNYDFKNKFLEKLGVKNQPVSTSKFTSNFTPNFTPNFTSGKSNFGSVSNKNIKIIVISIFICLVIGLLYLKN